MGLQEIVTYYGDQIAVACFTFYPCKKCGALVGNRDRQLHIEWHEGAA